MRKIKQRINVLQSESFSLVVDVFYLRVKGRKSTLRFIAVNFTQWILFNAMERLC